MSSKGAINLMQENGKRTKLHLFVEIYSKNPQNLPSTNNEIHFYSLLLMRPNTA